MRSGASGRKRRGFGSEPRFSGPTTADRRFDETTVSLHAGPRLLYGRGEVSLLATMNRRWYAGEAFGEGRGVRLEGAHRLDGRTRLGGRIGTTRQTHRRPSQHDGHRFHAGLDLARYVTPVLRLGVRGGWRRARTESPHERHTRRWVGVSAELDLPRIGRIRGLVLDVSRDFHFTGYERARLAYHPDPRRDRFDVSRLTVYSRGFEYRGFTPAVSLVHERRESNIALYDYDRTRVELMIQGGSDHPRPGGAPGVEPVREARVVPARTDLPDYVQSSARSGGLTKVAVILGARASQPANGARSAALVSLPRAGSPRSQEADGPSCRSPDENCA